MNERFTRHARHVVVEAQSQARALHHDEIHAEHLLLAVLADSSTATAAALRALGLDHDALARDVAPLGAADAAALNSLGIDLAAVNAATESRFGEGALRRARTRRAGLLGRLLPGAGSHIPFAPDAKLALEQSLRAARTLKTDFIGVEHIVLGALAGDTSRAARALSRLGVSPADVRDEMKAALRRAA